MHLRLIALALALLLSPNVALAAKRRDPAEAAYQQARRGYYALKDDPARRRLRHHWLTVIERFEAVAAKHPRSARAADALFTAAELRADLSRISLLDEDLRAAIAGYERLLDRYAKTSLADDAALALAKLQSHRLGHPEAAVATLERAAALGKGDRAAEIAAMYRDLSPGRRALRFGVPAPVATAAKAKPATKKPEPRVAAAKPAPTRHPGPRETASDGARPPRGEEAPVHTAQQDPPAASSAEPAAPGPAEAAVAVTTTSGHDLEDVRAATAPAADAATTAATRPPAPVAPHAASDALAEAFERATTGSPDVGAAPAEEDLPATTGRAAATQKASPVAGVATARRKLPKVSAHASDGGVTLAEQLGLKFRRVVIDPGHGGHDGGAVGKKGTREKDVALAVSLQLKELLEGEGLEVTLTRDDDRFIRLEDRARIANEAKGDLFISIHCNAAPTSKRRGVETYTLNTSADRYSIRLAARENASSERGVSDLQFILADLATKANTEESTRLARRVQESLVRGLSAKYSSVRDLGHKEALFYVLLGVRMPAILIETSFLSNPEEEKRLSSKAYQTELAKGIAAGVQDFLANRGRVARVD